MYLSLSNSYSPLFQSFFRDDSFCWATSIWSNLNKKTADGDSHPTTKKDRVQIDEAESDLTGEGKHKVATGCTNAGDEINY